MVSCVRVNGSVRVCLFIGILRWKSAPMQHQKTDRQSRVVILMRQIAVPCSSVWGGGGALAETLYRSAASKANPSCAGARHVAIHQEQHCPAPLDDVGIWWHAHGDVAACCVLRHNL